LRIAYFISVAVLLTISRLGYGQDPVFSQFYNASLYLNPALAGDEENPMLSAGYRSQWKTIHFPYTTSRISLLYPLYKDKHRRPAGHWGGVGVSVFNDQSGVEKNFKTTGANVALAYNLQFSQYDINRLSFAIQTGFIQKRVDTESLQWGEQYNPYVGFDASITPEEVNRINNQAYLDINAGAFYRFETGPDKPYQLIKGYYAGIAVSHLNHPNESVIDGQVIRLPLMYTYHGGVIFALGTRSFLSANLLTVMQDTQWQNNIGSFFSYLISDPSKESLLSSTYLKIGGWYRAGDSFIMNIGAETDLLRLGFSYDWNVSSLRYANRGIGTYEITIGVKLKQLAPGKVRY